MESRKIVAIGGGENGRQLQDGSFAPYETESIDKEIVRLTGKEHPNFLLIAHSQPVPAYEENYFHTMERIYGGRFGCACRWLKREDLKNNFHKAVSDVEWADIIYEGGGDTKSMMSLWKETGFDKVLHQAWTAGKVMCGLSAGANCWFTSCSSDALKMELHDESAPLIVLDCLDFIPAFFVPHCNEKGENENRLEHMKEALKEIAPVGLAVSNCAALEIIDNRYRLLTGEAAQEGFVPYGLKAYWENGEYREEKLDDSGAFRELGGLLEKAR